MQDVVSEIKIALDELDVEKARQLIRDSLRSNPTAQIYVLASKVALDDTQKENFLRKAVELDPFDVDANNALKQFLNKTTGNGAQAASPAAVQPEPKPIASTPTYTAQSSAIYPEPQKVYKPLYTPTEEDRAQPVYGAQIKIGSSTYQLADFGTRLIAFIIDQIVIGILGGIVGFIYGSIRPMPMSRDYYYYSSYINDYQSWFGIVSIISIILVLVYYIYYFTKKDGQTPGKSAMGIRVIKTYGNDLGAWDAIWRNIIGYAISSLVILLGFIWSLFDDKRQTWHDKMASTVVVKKDPVR